MKIRRLLSVFLLVALLCGLFTVPAAALEDPDIRAKAALLVEAETGTILYDKNAHDELSIASTTKIMSALLIFEAIERGELRMDQSVTATASALRGLPEDGSTADIVEGETLTVEQLLYCMLVISANETCNILGETVAGSVDAFVERMNQRAQELGCKNTHFANTTGLTQSGHYSCAYDLYLITRAALEHDDFKRICDTGSVTIPATNLSQERVLYTTNYLINGWRSRGYINRDAHGIKTGSTDAAGHCLVSSAQRGSLSFISVVLGCERLTLEGGEIRTMSFYETNRLFNWGFDNFSYKTVVTADEYPKEVPVSLSKTEHVTVHPAQNVEILMPNGLSAGDLERDIQLDSSPVEAPISQGQKLGTMTLSYEGKVYAQVDLLASNDVEASKLLTFWRDVKLFFAKPAVKIVGIILLVLLVLILLWKLVFGRRRYRYGRSVGRNQNRGYRGRRRF